MATHPMTPSFLVAAFSTLTGPPVTEGSSTSAWTPASIVVTGSVAVNGSAEGSGMANPWVEDGVQDVDEEVHGDVAEREDGDVALEGNVLARHDGIGDEEAHAVDVEDVLDHNGATDERADVEAGDGEQRETRGSQRMAPQDARGAQAFGARHRDEVLLQGGDHVAAQQTHVHRDLTSGEADGRQECLLEVVDGTLAEVDPAGRVDVEPVVLGSDVVGKHETEHEVRYCQQPERGGVDRLVEQRARTVGGRHPEGNCDHQGKYLRVEHQRQRDR